VVCPTDKRLKPFDICDYKQQLLWNSCEGLCPFKEHSLQHLLTKCQYMDQGSHSGNKLTFSMLHYHVHRYQSPPSGWRVKD
jgi:hypothetical protein